MLSGQRHASADLYPRERPGTHCTEGWVGRRAGLVGRKMSPPPGFDPRTVQSVVQTLYRLNYTAHYLNEPYLFFGKARLKRDGTRAETRFGLSAQRSSPFKLAGWGLVQSTAGSPRCAASAVVMLDTPCSEVV